MIFEGAWSEKDRGGATVRTRRVAFRSQPDQVAFLRNGVETYRHVHRIKEWAVDAIRGAGCPPRRRVCQAIAIARAAQRDVYYVNEGDETFQTPVRTLRDGYGDCDDFTWLVAAAVESIGIPCELVAMWIAWPPRGWRAFTEKHLGIPWELTRDGSYRHIFPRALIPRRSGAVRRLALDATLDSPAGAVDPVRMVMRRGDKVRLLVL